MFEILVFWICRDIASNIQCDINVIKDHQHSKPPPRKNVEFCDLSTRGYLSLHCEEWCHLNGESWPMYLTLWISLSKTTIKLTTGKRSLMLHSVDNMYLCDREKLPDSENVYQCSLESPVGPDTVIVSKWYTASWVLQWYYSDKAVNCYSITSIKYDSDTVI